MEALAWLRPILLRNRCIPVDQTADHYIELACYLYEVKRDKSEDYLVEKFLSAGLAKRVREKDIEEFLEEERASKDKRAKEQAEKLQEFLVVPKPKMSKPEFNSGFAVNFRDWYEQEFEDAGQQGPPIGQFDKWLETPLEWDEVRTLSTKIETMAALADYWDIIVRDTRYVGFDARVIATILWRTSAAHGDGEQGVANVFYADMAFLIVLFLQRGTSVIDHKKIGTMAQKTKKKVAVLKKKYGIIAKIANAKKDTAITLSRIAACFPLIACRAMAEGNIDRPVATESMAKEFRNFPKFLRNSCFFSLFYEGGKMTGIVMALLAYQFAEGEVINQKNADYKKKNKDEKMEDVIKYAHATYKSGVVSIPDRKKYATKYFGGITSGLMDEWAATFLRIHGDHAENIDTHFEQNSATVAT